MGNDSDHETKRKYLSKDEILSIKGIDNVNQIFNSNKNAKGIITLIELKNLTRGLLNDSVCKKIIKICGSGENKMTNYDLLYFFALLKTDSIDAKINFILDFIFTKKSILDISKYKKKVNKYYNKSSVLIKILLDSDLINLKEHIEKKEAFNYIKTKFEKEINDFKFYNNSYNVDKNNNKFEFTICECLKDKDDEKLTDNIYVPNLTNMPKKNYYLEFEFKLIEKENDNIFPINLFENMLKEINISQSLIDVIGNYLRQKSQKNFINYDLFEEIFSLLQINVKTDDEQYNKIEILEGLFKIFSYPNDYITKTAFFIFMKSTKKDISSIKINKIINDNNIHKTISQNEFYILANYIINELTESFEHLKYLPYIFFNKELKDKKLEKNCIDILLDGKSLDEYIYNRIEYDKKFYIINKSFWDRWEVLIPDPINNSKELKLLTVNYEEISHDKMLNEGLVYLKDYIILSPTIYKLFSKWYHFPNNYELERERINISFNLKENQMDMLQIDNSNLHSKITEEDEFKTFQTSKEFMNSNGNIINKSISKNNKKMFINKHFEIEVFPVFLIFYKMENIIKKGLKDVSSFKKILDNISRENKKFIYNKFSRKTKVRTIIDQMQDFFENKLTPITARLWFYLNNKVEIIPYEDSLEKHGITNITIAIIETKKNGLWQIDALKVNSSEEEGIVDTTPLVGLTNVGNSCYMNSVLQIFFNIPEMKNIFIKNSEKSEETEENIKEIFSQDFLHFIFKEHKINFLLKNFLHLLKLKWLGSKKTLNPKAFKDICGKYNNTFLEDEQQDAYDFYTFLLDTLHEESNIKFKKEEIKINDDNYNNEQDLANEYWANTIRNNASYFYALFMGQIQSKLICSECQQKKIKFEPINALNLPIPESNKYIIKICLFRLPITLSPFFKQDKEFLIENNSARNKILTSNKTRKKLFKLKDNCIGVYSKYTNNNVNSISRNHNNNVKKENNDNNEEGVQITDKTNKSDANLTVNLNTEFFDNELRFNKELKGEDDIIANPLMFNIPLHIKIEIDKNKKCKDIIEELKNMEELHLDKEEKYSEFIMFDEDYLVIDLEQIIENKIFPLKEIYIYELLSSIGVQKVFGYNDLIENEGKINKLNEDKNDINRINTNANLQNNINNKEIIETNKNKNDINILGNKRLNELLIEITHRYRKDTNECKDFFYLPRFDVIYTYKDYLILPNKNSIKPYNLYEMLWEKYMYFLNNPYDKFVWWKSYQRNKNNLNQIYKRCSPFVIKIILPNGQCPFCPWYKFCTGCILNPDDQIFLEFESKSWIIVVEWCKEIAEIEMNKNNITLSLFHQSYYNLNNDDTKSEKISIYDCLDLFTQKEDINDFFCENCNKKTKFTKELKIERLPEYLFVVFKRFKYISKYSTKIESLISFPFEDLKLNEYMMAQNKEKNKTNIKKYDLFACINHIGTLHKGHYYCDLKQEKKWFKYDDAHVEEDEDINVSNIYILIYKANNDDYYNNKNYFFNFNFLSVMDTAYKIYIGQLNFEHIFNYILDDKGEIIEEFRNNCFYYYGEPVFLKDNKGYLVNMYKNNKSEICAKIQVNNGIVETKIKGSDIKEIIKKDFMDNIATNNDNDEICSGCMTY